MQSLVGKYPYYGRHFLLIYNPNFLVTIMEKWPHMSVFVHISLGSYFTVKCQERRINPHKILNKVSSQRIFDKLLRFSAIDIIFV